MLERDFYWMVGILEGEGSFLKSSPSRSNSPAIACNMTDEDIISRLSMLLGVGYYPVQPKKEHWKVSYRCCLRGKRAVEIMQDLWPEMGLRRQQQINRALSSFDPTAGKILLNADKAVAIRQDLANGVSVRDLSTKFGVTISTIYDIKNRRSWSEVA